jgi:hypothetical protein
VALALGSIALTTVLWFSVTSETRGRRDQACRGLELGHRQEVRQLRRTYRFYLDPPPSFRDLLSNPLVAQQLREDERAAQSDQDQYGVFVPKYCDEPGVGLPEPDPKVPERPPELSPPPAYAHLR